MEYHTYILKSLADGRLYVGSTLDTERRLKEHNQGKVAATRNRRPLEIIHKESYPTQLGAYRRERYLKSGIGREEIRKILGSSPAAKH